MFSLLFLSACIDLFLFLFDYFSLVVFSLMSIRKVQVSKGVCYLAGGGLTHHRLVRRRQLRRIHDSRAVNGNAVYGAEGGMREVQMQTSGGGRKVISV